MECRSRVRRVFHARGAHYRVMLIFTGLVSVFLLWSPDALADGQTDAATVYCMDTARQNQVVDAGIALGLGTRASSPDQLTVDHQELDVTTWRSQRGSDFDRACLALFVAAGRTAPASSGGGLTPWISLAGIVVGALLTLLATSWRDKVARGGLQAEAFQTCVGDFIRSSESYLDGWVDSGARPDDGPVRAERGRVFDKLGPIRVLHPGWAVVKAIRGRLTTGPLGADLTADWARLDATGRTARADDLKKELNGLRDDGNRLAYAIGRPIRSSLRRRALKSGRKP